VTAPPAAAPPPLPRVTLRLCVLGLLAAGCGAPPPIFEPLAHPLHWPEPPEQARFEYVGEITGERDLKRPVSFWAWLGSLIAGAEPPASFLSAHAVAVSAAGVLYVADPEARVVHRLDLESREYRALADAGGGRRFALPIGLALAGDTLLVADRALGTVTAIGADGAPPRVFGAGLLKGPVGVAAGPSGRIYVADAAEHRVRAFLPSGDPALDFGGRGVDDGQFNFPTHVACAPDGKLFVSDSMNSRIQVFDAEGRFLTSIGRRGDAPGEFAQPKGVACDPKGRGMLYAVDARFENVQVFDAEGRLLMAFGGEGSGPGEFWLPVGVFADLEDRVWVADSFNRRVQVFRYLDDKAEGQETKDEPSRSLP
jgi:sugar lactone lactonase YvrE